MTSGIYKITNTINNKIYIGQSIHIEQRWKEHLSGRGSKALYQDFLFYGTQNFTFEILEICTDKTLLREREKFWVRYYNSYLDGYNGNEGGDSVLQAVESTKKSIFCYDLFGNFIQMFPSLSEAERITGINNSNISRAAKTKGRTKNFQWRYQYYDSIPPYKRRIGNIGKRVCGRPVIQYDKNYNFIQQFDTIREAERSTGIHGGSISEACSNKRKTAGGFIWKYASDKEK